METPYLNLETDDDSEPDTSMFFPVFMMVFWPVSIILGLIDYYLVRDYDLRVPTLLLGLGAGWLGIQWYKTQERQRKKAV